MYVILNQVSSSTDVEPRRNKGLRIIWEVSVPSKLKLFGWRFVLDRLPTRNHLFNRGVILLQQEARCVFCQLEQEDFNHFLLNCPALKSLWIKLQGWLDIQLEEDIVNCLGLLLIESSQSSER